MSNMTETLIDYVFDNDTIDWANKIDIPIPSDIKTVFIDLYPGGALQTGADNPVRMRVNSGTSASYCNAVKYHNGTAYTTSFSVTDTSMGIYVANANDPNAGCSQVTLHTRNGSLGTNAIPYGQVIYNALTSTFLLETRLIRVLDSVNPVGTINIFTTNSTAVSFRMKVRLSR